MRCRVGHSGRAWAGFGARVLAVLVGLDLGLGWVPAAGVSARFAAAVAAVALVVVATGQPGGRWARPSRLDAASALALGTTLLAGAGAAFVPPDFGADPARPAWLAVAMMAGVAMVGLAFPPLPALAPASQHRLSAGQVDECRGDAQSRTRSYR
jgi:hypothetical protein